MLEPQGFYPQRFRYTMKNKAQGLGYIHLYKNIWLLSNNMLFRVLPNATEMPGAGLYQARETKGDGNRAISEQSGEKPRRVGG